MQWCYPLIFFTISTLMKFLKKIMKCELVFRYQIIYILTPYQAMCDVHIKFFIGELEKFPVVYALVTNFTCTLFPFFKHFVISMSTWIHSNSNCCYIFSLLHPPPYLKFQILRKYLRNIYFTPVKDYFKKT